MPSFPQLNPSLRAALARREKAFGMRDLMNFPLENVRASELRLAKSERYLMPKVASSEEITLSDTATPLTALQVTPDGRRDGAILYIHGGGWAFGSHKTHEDPVRRLAIATGMPIISVSYRLAPEHPFPNGLNDCIAAWRSLLAGQITGASDNGPLLIAGDSAGANLALGVMLNELKAGREIASAALLFYGVYGSDFSTPSYVQWPNGPVLTREKMQRYWDWYCAPEKRNDCRSVPLAAPAELLHALPDTYMAAAEIDPLLSENEQLFTVLANDDTRNDTFALWRGLAHGSLGAACYVPEVRMYIAKVGQWVRERFPPNDALLTSPHEIRGQHDK